MALVIIIIGKAAELNVGLEQYIGIEIRWTGLKVIAVVGRETVYVNDGVGELVARREDQLEFWW